MKNNQIVVGATYKHYRNRRLYRVMAVAKHSETLEEMVVYEALYANDVSSFWVRPSAMFLENVDFEGVSVPRFELQV